MTHLARSAVILAMALASAACSRGDAAVVAAPAAAAPVPPSAPPSPVLAAAPQGAGRPKLVFFMNPSGRPCQMQDQVLRSMAGELAGRADLVYFRTTEGNDLPRFEQYGIRSLPALVLTDANGAELRRATPGIQSEAQVRALVGP